MDQPTYTNPNTNTQNDIDIKKVTEPGLESDLDILKDTMRVFPILNKQSTILLNENCTTGLNNQNEKTAQEIMVNLAEDYLMIRGLTVIARLRVAMSLTKGTNINQIMSKNGNITKPILKIVRAANNPIPIQDEEPKKQKTGLFGRPRN